jgi:hypothetical protein
MCLYSTFVHATDRRTAKVGETLTRGSFRNHSCLLGDDGKVTCIKPGTTMVIESAIYLPQLKDSVKDLRGKTIKVVLLRPTMRGYSADQFELPNGTVASLEWLVPGSVFRIPRKVRKDAGTKRPRNLDKVLNLDSIRADIPVERETVKV